MSKEWATIEDLTHARCVCSHVVWAHDHLGCNACYANWHAATDERCRRTLVEALHPLLLRWQDDALDDLRKQIEARRQVAIGSVVVALDEVLKILTRESS